MIHRDFDQARADINADRKRGEIWRLTRAQLGGDRSPAALQILEDARQIRGHLSIRLRSGCSSVPCPPGANIETVLEKRALSTTGTEGGHTAPNALITALEAGMIRSNVARQFATIVRTTSGSSIPWPMVNDTAASSSVIGENSAAPAPTDFTFGQSTTSPYLYAAPPIVMSQQLRDDSFDGFLPRLGMLLGGAMGQGILIDPESGGRMGRGQDADFITGTGSGQRRGILLDADDSGVTLSGGLACLLSPLPTARRCWEWLISAFIW